MDQVIGSVMSDTSKVNYEVKFNNDDSSVFIKRPNTFGWMKAGDGAKNEQDALQKAYIFINSRPDMF